MQELLLIRHASTDMAGTLCGQSDPPLNALGREQAGILAPLLQSCDVRRIYASDLQRALQTAQPLAELCNVPITVRRDLREISFGTWEGKRWSEIRADRPDLAAMESSPGPCAPGGEAFSCFRHRVTRAVERILADCNGRLAAVVTHLGVMRVILSELKLTDSLWEPQQRIDYCSVYRIRVNGDSLELAEIWSRPAQPKPAQPVK